MPDDDRLIQALRAARQAPPPAPADEWSQVAKRTVNIRQARRGRVWAWSVGVSLAGLLLAVGLGLPRRHAGGEALAPAEELRQDLEPLSNGLQAPQGEDASAAPGAEMLALLDSV